MLTVSLTIDKFGHSRCYVPVDDDLVGGPVVARRRLNPETGFTKDVYRIPTICRWTEKLIEKTVRCHHK